MGGPRRVLERINVTRNVDILVVYALMRKLQSFGCRRIDPDPLSGPMEADSFNQVSRWTAGWELSGFDSLTPYAASG